MPSLQKNLAHIEKLGIESLFKKINRGIEKESLRVDPDGALAHSPHPKALGAALTHPSITTDYSEAQLEFVSPVTQDIDTLSNFLTNAHHFTYQNIGDEKLWANSMPCILRGDDSIPIARFGRSNVAKMKETYRMGLGHRYGRLMQTISGIHYNFSLPAEFWPHFFQTDAKTCLKDHISAQYLGLIRNFHRHSWLLFYLLGASPSVCKTFLAGREHNLEEYANNSYFAPYATSLRMSDLGYSNSAQSGIHVCYNQLSNFTESLSEAMRTSIPEYEKTGVKVNGEYQQLNTNLLQIENEFYASIRPKRVIKSGEKPSIALKKRGIEYVEVRCIDLNPYVPIGIDEASIIFLDMFLLYCLFQESPSLNDPEMQQCKSNNQLAIMRGREPNLMLARRHGSYPDNSDISLQNWGKALIHAMQPIAEMLDSIHFSSRFRHVLSLQAEKIADSSKTPSAKILHDVQNNYASFFEFSLAQSRKHERFFKHLVLNQTAKAEFEQAAKDSILKQKALEAADTLSFDDYLTEYFAA